jgi:hypothetical protein
VLRRIKRTRKGDYAVNITKDERELILHLMPQLRELLLEDDSEAPALRRLFPRAYLDDDKSNDVYRETMHDQLLKTRLEQIETIEHSAMASRLNEDEIQAWIGAINGLRLVMGTWLDVSEDDPDPFDDPDDPEAMALAMYHYLSHLLGELIAAVGP